jgi:hypothetical protein
MSAGRILGLLLAVAAVVWLIPSPGVLGPGKAGTGLTSAAGKARAAARAGNARSAQLEALNRGLESQASGAGGAVSESMTTDQVRALIGPPDSVESQTGEDGIARERWTYRQVGKTIVFENGVVVRVE